MSSAPGGIPEGMKCGTRTADVRFGMKDIEVPENMLLWPDMVGGEVMDIRMKLGVSHITLNYCETFRGHIPVLAIDFYNEKGKMYTLHCRLPPGRSEQTEYRVTMLLRCIHHSLTEWHSQSSRSGVTVNRVCS